MAYNRVNWENGSIRTEGYVDIEGVRYPVVQPEYEGTTPINEENLNIMDQGIFDNAVNVLSALDNEGTIKIGNIGIEWGTVSITPENGYGSINVNLTNNYSVSPFATAVAGVGTSQITNVGTFNVSRSRISVFMTSTSTQTRTCRYLVIGILSSTETVG